MSRSVSNKVKVLIVGYRKFSELITAVIPEFTDEADITIVESLALSLIHISEPTRPTRASRMPSSA